MELLTSVLVVFLAFVAAIAAALYWAALRFPDDGRPFSRFRACVSLLRILVCPSGSSTVKLYETWQGHFLSDANQFINLGYWREARDLDEAAVQLARLLGETAGLGPGDRVVDVGYGFGDQDVYWVETFGPDRIDGVNITPVQVHHARNFVNRKGLQHRIDLREGSANAMPYRDGYCDAIMALECAFHFDTRDQFFREAWRTLLPGGRLALTDVVPDVQSRSVSSRVLARLLRAFWQIPRENWYDCQEYQQRLEAAGFEQVRVQSIRDDVFTPLRTWVQSQLRENGVLQKLHPLHRNRLSSSLYTSLLTSGPPFPPMDYILVSAVKVRGDRTSGNEGEGKNTFVDQA